MFNKLKAKAGQPLTYGWLYKCYLSEIIAVGVVYGGIWLYGRYLEKKSNESEAANEEEMNYNEFEDED